jgi:ABC-type transport system involved in cytochrome c biogenesis permease subunit
VNQLSVATGLFMVSFWGRPLWIPLLAAAAKPRAARKLARQRVVVRLETRHALETAALAAD